VKFSVAGSLWSRVRAGGSNGDEDRSRKFPIAEPTDPLPSLIEITSCQQQTQRTLLDWLRVEYAIEKPSIKLFAATDLDSDTLVAEVKRIRGKKLPLTSPHAPRSTH